MLSQMNVVQNAARLAMADHRAAESRLLQRGPATRGVLLVGLIVPLAFAAGAIAYFVG